MRNWKVIIVSIIVLGVAAAVILSPYLEKQRQRAIIQDARPLFSDCDAGQTSDAITLTGKALVWDLKLDDRSNAYDRLPADLQAHASDEEMTIFAIVNKRPEVLGTYAVTGQKAVQVRAIICVVSWPDKKVLGLTAVMGLPPPDEKDVTTEAASGVGDINAPIAEWIEGLPKNK